MSAQAYKAEGALRDVMPAIKSAGEQLSHLEDDVAKVQAALLIALKDGGISEAKATGIAMQLAEAVESLAAALELADEVVARELLTRWGRKS